EQLPGAERAELAVLDPGVADQLPRVVAAVLRAADARGIRPPRRRHLLRAPVRKALRDGPLDARRIVRGAQHLGAAEIALLQLGHAHPLPDDVAALLRIGRIVEPRRVDFRRARPALPRSGDRRARAAVDRAVRAGSRGRRDDGPQVDVQRVAAQPLSAQDLDAVAGLGGLDADENAALALHLADADLQ